MLHKVSLAIVLFNLAISLNAQFDMADYAGGWQGNIDSDALSITITLEQKANNTWDVSLANSNVFFQKSLTSKNPNRISLELGPKLTFNGEMSSNVEAISGFLFSSSTFFHLQLTKVSTGKFQGKWNTFFVDQLKPAKVYLAIENASGENYEAYPIFPDNRYRGTYATNFEKSNNQFDFDDLRAGYHFKGVLEEDKIKMVLLLADKAVTSVEFTRSVGEWDRGTTASSANHDLFSKPIAHDDGWATDLLNRDRTQYASLQKMSDSITANSLTAVHSVLIAKKGKLIFEQYFSGFHKDLPQDQRSAAKSIGSAMVGIAQAEGYIGTVQSSIFDYLPANYQYARNEQNAKINLSHLLTMSSGMDAIDFGIDRVGKATEDYYQNTPDWLKTVLEAPMLFEPGAHCNYGSANPYLLGVALSNEIEQPVEDYMHEKLLAPLGITNYVIPADPKGQPYFGGGMYLTPRDMLKFGELYRCKGQWKGKKIIPEKWIEDSFKNYMVLENTTEKNGYGYLWWHESYDINGKKIEAIEARGAGGQIISVIPELDIVVVITSGNYRNGRYWQPQLMMKDYILPALVE